MNNLLKGALMGAGTGAFYGLGGGILASPMEGDQSQLGGMFLGAAVGAAAFGNPWRLGRNLRGTARRAMTYANKPNLAANSTRQTSRYLKNTLPKTLGVMGVSTATGLIGSSVMESNRGY